MGKVRIHYVMAGQVFGRWTVVEPEGSVKGQPGALCECSCGTRRMVSVNNLVHGRTKSCGCLKKQNFDQRTDHPPSPRQTTEQRRAAGLCTRCGVSFEPSSAKNGRPHVQCPDCRSRLSSYAMEWRNGRLDGNRAYQRNFNRRRRQMVYDRYGGKCVCCGETQFEFLAIDHINGGGKKHRSDEGIRGSSVIGWIIAHDYPDDLRVLCHNCNLAYGFYGSCPHREPRKAS